MAKNKSILEETEPVEAKKSRFKLPRLEKRVKSPKAKPISGSFRLFADSVSLVRQHWKLFGGIALVYIVLTAILVGMSSGVDINQWREDLNDASGDEATGLGTGVILFGLLVGSSGKTGTEGGLAYQTLIVLIVSLAVIWALRHILAGEKVSVRDAFYKGMYPLVPFTLVLVAIGVQLIPLMIGTFLYGAAFNSEIAVGTLEKSLWAALVALAAFLSLYMITASVFALYIATLPDMRPMKALRSARELVRFRRWTVLRKLLFIPLALVLIVGVLTVPFLVYLPGLASWVFVISTMFGVVVAHTYVYNLYRELL
jgi:hypothetical protein